MKCKLIFLLLSGLSCIPNCGNLHTEGEEIRTHFGEETTTRITMNT